jgi:TatD DNase family protein
VALIDTHCHLDYEAFEEDRDEVVARAKAAGLVAIINPGTNVHSSRAALGLAEAHEIVYAAVGVHPNDAAEWDDGSLGQIAGLAEHPKAIAIGEIGLDYYREWTPPESQHKIFRGQLGLAAELGLPVIIHNRQAEDDIMTILFEWQKQLEQNGSPLAKRPGVLHSFGANLSFAEAALQHNFFIGLTGPLTFKNAPDLQDLAAQMPLEKLLVETDSPYLSPHPLRGQRNEPGRVKLVAEKLAELHGMAFEAMAEITTANARRLFGLGAAA